MTEEDIEAIRRYLGINLTDPAVRQRAWRRLRVFRSIIAECETDRQTADWLRDICHRGMVEQDAACLAILAGPEDADRFGS